LTGTSEAAGTGSPVAPQTVIDGAPGCTNNLSSLPDPAVLEVYGNMSGCVPSNLTYYISARTQALTSAISTYCERPYFYVYAPPGECITVTTDAVGHSSMFQYSDSIRRTFTLVG